VSIIVPLYNEEDNVKLLYEQIIGVLEPLRVS
jgi:glycosyltransferase involved in cell wall biosynthesis